MRVALFAVGLFVVLGAFTGYRAMLGGYKNVDLASNDVGVEGARGAVSDKVGFPFLLDLTWSQIRKFKLNVHMCFCSKTNKQKKKKTFYFCPVIIHAGQASKN
jgi:hypothetical protein